MSDAHPSRKLGRRPKTNAPRLRVEQFLDVSRVPAHPAQDDNLAGLTFGLYENDRLGDCGPVSVANNVIAVTRGRVVPSVGDVIDLYSRVSGYDPQTGAHDDGVVMQDMLGELARGGIGGRKPVAFGAVSVTDVQLLEAAIATFDGALLGVDLQVAQQAQTDRALWKYAAPHSEWGGHAVLSGRYVDEFGLVRVVTWAELVDTDSSFRANQLDEVWVVVWPEHLSRPGVDVQALAAVYKALTGRVLPVPAPAPTPGPSVDQTLWDSTKAWASASHTGSNKKAATAVKAWAKAKGLT
jgi:hypothetical protein